MKQTHNKLQVVAVVFSFYITGACTPVDPIYAEAQDATQTVQESCIYEGAHPTQPRIIRITLRMEIPPSSQEILALCWPDVALEGVPDMKTQGKCADGSGRGPCDYTIDLPANQTNFKYLTRCWGLKMGPKKKGAQIQRSGTYQTAAIATVDNSDGEKICLLRNQPGST